MHQSLCGLGCQFSRSKWFTSVYAPAGYADRMELTQFRRHFQVLAHPEMKKFTSAYELTDEKKVRRGSEGGRDEPRRPLQLQPIRQESQPLPLSSCWPGTQHLGRRGVWATVL